jgi:DNA-directed RNA polymerase beta' subunit
LGYLPLALPIAHIWYYHYEPNSLPYLTGFSRRLFYLILRYERIVAEEAILTFRESDLPYFAAEFRPVERLTVSSSSSRILPFRSESKKFLNSRNKYFATRYTNKKPPRFIRAKKGVSYANALSSYTTIFPKVKVCVFPWYCLYRDIPFFLFSSDEKKENFLSNYNCLEILNKLLVRHPKQTDYFLDFYRGSDNKFGEEHYCKLPQTGALISIRSHVFWFSEEPSRTGRGILSNRMLALNQKEWSLQANQRLKVLGMDIETFEHLGSLDKRKRLKYRRSIRTRNKILVRLRVLIEIRLADIQPHWLILQCLPILPPDLRPILSLG